MMDIETARALAATVTTSAEGGVNVSTTGVTIAPGVKDFEIEQGQTFDLYVTWYKDGAAQDLSTGSTAQLIAYTASGGTAFNLTQAAGITFASGDRPYLRAELTAAQTAALSFVRASHRLTVTVNGGTVVPLLVGCIDLRKAAIG